MKNRNKIIFLSLILISINLNFYKIEASFAVVYPQLNLFSGGILPGENVSLSLTFANARIDVDTSDLKYLGAASFYGNYTIFNPNNDINLTIGAPHNFDPGENCTVLVNGSLVPFNIIDDFQLTHFYPNEFELWKEYRNNRTSYILPGYWIICNISIQKNTSIELYYEFYSTSHTNPYIQGSNNIIYDVGTTRLWDGNITETVEIRVYGHLPTSIYNEQLCNVSDLSGGRSYKWKWTDERITINDVGLYYYFDNRYEYVNLYYAIRISLITAVFLIGMSLIFIKKYYKKHN